MSATAARDRSPRPPGLRCLCRRARLHRILTAPGPRRPPRSRQTRRLFALGPRGWAPAAGRVCVRGRASWVSPPAAGPERARSWRGTAEGIPPPPSPLITRGWMVVVRRGRLRGPGPQFPRLKRDTQEPGVAGRARSARPLPLPLPALASSARLGFRASPGAGLGARVSDPKVESTARSSWRRNQKELATRMSPPTSGPDPFSLGFAEITTPS